MMPIATTRHLKDAWSRVGRLISLSIQIVRLSLAVGLACFVFESCFELTFIQLVRNRQAWTFHLERGMLAIQRLEGWRNPQPRHYGELITIRKPLEKLAPWNWAWSASAPSWWGDVGYDVRRRGRFLGFEFASGIFWPPLRHAASQSSVHDLLVPVVAGGSAPRLPPDAVADPRHFPVSRLSPVGPHDLPEPGPNFRSASRISPAAGPTLGRIGGRRS